MRLIAEKLHCVRGGRELYDRVSFSVGEGEVLLLTGANGAGKTSLLRQIAGLLPLDGGSLHLEGGEIAEDAHFAGHATAVKDALSVFENLAFWSAVYGSTRYSLADALDRLRLRAVEQLPARVLSAGQKRRLALARLLTIDRKLWLLDEPDAALDAEGRDTLLGILAEHRACGGLAVIATHGTMPIGTASEISLGARTETVAA